jgi:pimeloyl-ACP methyl ester carboxylesterase
MSAVTRHFANVGGRQLHYRRGGSGPPAVLLHPSPLSSLTFVSLAESLSAAFTVFALDRAGYGGSEPLELDAPNLRDYSEALAGELDAIGIESTILYGKSTGSAVALEFARRYPARVAQLILENLPVWTEGERAELTAEYLPSIAAEWDGSHLPRAWAIERDQQIFWPFYRREAQARRDADMVGEHVVHNMVMDLLVAGPRYDRAYRAVFDYEPVPAIQELTVPTVIAAREGAALLEYLERIPADAPCQIELWPRDAAPHVARLLATMQAAAPRLSAPAPAQAEPLPGRVSRTYVGAPGAQVSVRRQADATGRPLIMLHRTPRSSASLEPMVHVLARSRTVIALDTPGFGGSDRLAAETVSIDGLAAVVEDVIEELAPGGADVYGQGTGSLIAVELALRAPALVNQLILEMLPLLPAELRAELNGRYTVPLEPRWDGTHLSTAWNYVRDGAFWWPWYERTRERALKAEPPSPEVLHAQVMELLQGARSYEAAFAAAFSYPLAERLPKLTVPTLICARDDHFLHAYLDEATALAPEATAQTLPAELEATTAIFDGFLAGATV